MKWRKKQVLAIAGVCGRHSYAPMASHPKPSAEMPALKLHCKQINNWALTKNTDDKKKTAAENLGGGFV